MLDWLAEERGALDVAVVDAAIALARARPQRRGLRALAVGAEPGPPIGGFGLRRMPATLRVALAVMLLAALLVAAAWAGSRLLERQVNPLPPPFGPAGNGLVAFSIDDDVYLGDPVTGSDRLLAIDVGNSPVFDRSGTRMATSRSTPSGAGVCYGPPPVPACTVEIVVTDMDGRSSVVSPRPLPYPALVRDWSGDGRWILVSGPGSINLIAADGSMELQVAAAARFVFPRFAADSTSLWLDEQGSDGTLRPLRVDFAGNVLSRFPLVAGRINLVFDPSPDGSRIAIAGSGPTIVIVRLDGRIEQTIDLGIDVSQVSEVSWSPDGRSIAAETVNGPVHHVVIVDPANATPARSLHRAAFSTCRWSPDGNALLCNDGDVAWWIVDLAGGARRTSWPGDQIAYPPTWQRLAVEERS
jgi:WD40 repeat protein